MNSLNTRKQILIAESEINRAQLAEELEALSAGVSTVANRAKSFSSIASAAAVLVVGLTALRRGNPGVATAKLSWLQTILKVGGLISSSWLALRWPAFAGPKRNGASREATSTGHSPE